MAEIHDSDLCEGDRLVARLWQITACWTWRRSYTVHGGAICCNFNFPHGMKLMEKRGEFASFSKIVRAGESD